jgi:hypothetical protein
MAVCALEKDTFQLFQAHSQFFAPGYRARRLGAGQPLTQLVNDVRRKQLSELIVVQSPMALKGIDHPRKIRNYVGSFVTETLNDGSRDGVLHSSLLRQLNDLGRENELSLFVRSGRLHENPLPIARVFHDLHLGPIAQN